MSPLIARIERGEFTLIAEVGVNYYDIAEKDGISPLEAAKLMCKEALEAGAHAVKFQSYKAAELAVEDSPAYWDTSEETCLTQRALFEKFDSFGQEQYEELARYCEGLGIAFCSTAFDFHSADYLEPLMDVYKVSSSDITNLPFIKYQAAKGKPMIMSVGASNLEEIERAVETVRMVNDQLLVLCHCVLEYPTPYADANLSRIRSLAEAFPGVRVGYSDHCRPDGSYDVIKTAYLLGAKVVEKHFTLDKTLKGNDHYHAMDPDDIRGIIEGIAFLDQLLGDPSLSFFEGERAARLNARRSIVSARDIRKGEIIVEDMLAFKRPGTGLSPADLSLVLGAVAVSDIPDDTMLLPEMIASR